MIVIITLCLTFIEATKLVVYEYSMKQLAFDEEFIDRVSNKLQRSGENKTEELNSSTDGTTFEMSNITPDVVVDDKILKNGVSLKDASMGSKESMEAPAGFIVPEYENAGQKRFKTVTHQTMTTNYLRGDNITKENKEIYFQLISGFIAELFKIAPNDLKAKSFTLLP